jgi:hypothetical protein
MKCPNKNSAEWVRLVNALGETNAYKVFIHNGEEVPEMSKVNEYIEFWASKLENQNFDAQDTETLDYKLLSFVNTLGFDIEFVKNLKDITGYNALSATDLLYKVILIKDSETFKTLPKEAAYVAYSMLGRLNKVRTDLFFNIEKLDNYNEKFEEYKTKSPNLSVPQIKKLIVIDYLADAIKNNFEHPKDSYIHRKADYWGKGTAKELSFLESILKELKQLFEKLFKTVEKEFTKEDVINLIDSFANDIINSNFDKFSKNLESDVQLTNYEETIKKDAKAESIINNFFDLKFLLTGSLALRLQGTLFRSEKENLHDLDFTILTKNLSLTDNNNVNKLIKVFKTYKLNGDKKRNVRKIVEQFDYIKAIKKLYPEYTVEKVFSKNNTLTITGSIGDHVIDIFTSDADTLSSDINSNIQSWTSIISAKILMGRMKDLNDFFNFKPYSVKEEIQQPAKGFRHFVFNDVTLVKAEEEEVSNQKEYLGNKTEPIDSDIKYQRKKKKLVDIFNKAGVKVNFTEKEEGNYYKVVNGNITINIDPNKRLTDSVFHEFGHLFIDILGYTNPVVQRGIEQLRGTMLWTKTKRIYPELSEQDLAKEVLTTAIGIKADELYDTAEEVKTWKYWLNRLFTKISNFLGLNDDAIKQLADDLITGELKTIIDERLEDTLMWQKDAQDIEQLKSVLKYLEDERAQLHLHKLQFRNNLTQQDSIAKINTVLEEERFLQKMQIEAADLLNRENLGKIKRSLTKTVLFEKESLLDFETFINRMLIAKGGENFYSDDARKLAEYVERIRKFLVRTSAAKNLKNIDIFETDTTEVKALKKTINATIFTIEKNSNRINKLRQNFQVLLDRYQESFARTSNDPNVIKHAATIFQDGLIDETAIALKTDSLSYSRHALGANFAKLLAVNEHKVHTKTIAKINQFKKRWAKFTESKYSIIDLIDENKNLIHEYDIKGFNDALTAMYESVVDLADDDVKRIKIINDFYTENTQQQYTKEFYTLEQKLSEKNRNFVISSRTAKNKILSKYNKETVKTLDKDKGTLAYKKKTFNSKSIKYQERKELGELKTLSAFYSDPNNFEVASQEYIDAKELAKYYEDITEMMESFLIVPLQEVLDDLAKFKAIKNTDTSKHTIQRNFKPSPAFWDKFNGILSILRSDSNVDINEEIKKLTKPYLDDQGRVMGHLVPEKVALKIRRLQDSVKSEEEYDGPANADFDDALKEFQDLVDFQTTEYYDIELAKQIDLYAKRTKKLKNGFEDTAWYKLNHTENPYTKKIEPIRIWTTIMPKDLSINLVSTVIKGQIVEYYDSMLMPGGVYTSSKVKSQFINPKFKADAKGMALPNSNWINPGYDVLKSKPEAFEFYTYFKKEFADLLKHTNLTAAEANIPSMGTEEYIKLEKKKPKKPHEQVIDISGEKVLITPLRFIGLLGAEKLLPVRRKMRGETPEAYEASVLSHLEYLELGEFKTLQEVIDKNNEIKLANLELHKNSINLDLGKTFPKFIEAAVSHEMMQHIKSDITLLRYAIANSKIIRQDGKGSILDLLRSKATGTSTNVLVDAKDSNVLKHIDLFIEMLYEGNYLEDEGLKTKLGQGLKQFISLKGLYLNMFAAIKNEGYGMIQMAIESGSEIDFDRESFASGMRSYHNGLGSYFTDMQNDDITNASSIENALIKRFGIYQDTRELSEKNNNFEFSKETALQRVNDFGFFMMNGAEHQMQMTGMFSMMHSHRVIGGKIMNFRMYKESLNKPTKEEIIKNPTLMEEYNEKVLKAKEEFKTYKKVLEMYELKDGLAVLKPNSGISILDESAFRRKIMAVNHRIHGIYNTFDKGTIEHTITGQLIMQFRHWAMPGWNKRFGQVFGETIHNESLGYASTGDYISAWKFLTRPFKEAKDFHWNEDGDRDFYATLGSVINNYAEFVQNLQIYWFELSDIEKGEIKRFLLEMITVVAFLALVGLLRSFADDDEDLKASTFYNLALYELDGIASELNTYSPYGWINESQKLVQNPAAAFKASSDILTLLTNVAKYPLNIIAGQEDKNYYRGGARHGELKVQVQFIKTLPLANQIDKWFNLENNNRYYKLYSAN